ncbi:MAG: OmpA family protein, partial [Verrucomicrobia bacterium]|nr:OmpA family protein [Cytophagales bacterium]
VQSIFAQTTDKRWAVSGAIGTRQYKGDLGNHWFDFKDVNPTGYFAMSRFLNPSFDIFLAGNAGLLSFSDNSNQNFETTAYDGALGLRFKTYNGKIFKENAAFAPYLTIGAGYLSATNNVSQSQTGAFNFPAGLGFRIRVSEGFNFFIQSTYNFHLTDAYDGLESGDYDNFLQHNVGVTLNFGGSKKDDDQDGIINRKDECPQTPAGYKVDEKGCPLDDDKDGVFNEEDKCPQETGTPQTLGCPDKDNDGVSDSEDKCPEQAGNFNGCPDKDSDGIIDSEDKCPEQKGSKEANGCPDADNDGVVDENDKCPDQVGSKRAKGCPDRDNDGIEDENDKCPDAPGILSTKGCPPVQEDNRKKLASIAKNIQFKTGSVIITEQSVPSLDEVADIMKRETLFELDIEGHTDNQGNAAANKLLSQKRADAVKNYLIKKGIAKDRMIARGYGAERPLTSNDTPERRAKNRRVDLVVVY